MGDKSIYHLQNVFLYMFIYPKHLLLLYINSYRSKNKFEIFFIFCMESDNPKIEAAGFQQLLGIPATRTFTTSTPPYDETYLNGQLETLEKKTLNSWIKMLEKAQTLGAHRLAERAKLKILPFFMNLDENILQQCQYDFYYREIMKFITDNQKYDQESGILYNLGIAFLILGDIFRASSFLISALQHGLDISTDERSYVYGYIYFYRKEYKLSIELFSKTVNHPNEDIMFYSRFLRGVAYRRTKQFQESIDDFEFLKNFSSRYITKNDVIVQQTDSIIQKEGNYHSFLNYFTVHTLGDYRSFKQVYYSKIKYTQATDLFDMSILRADDQTDRDVLIMNIYVLILNEKYLNACSLIRELLDSNNMDHAFWYLLGFCFIKMSQYSQSAIAFQNAVVLNPTNTKYKTALGLALELNMKKDDALALYTNPSNEQCLVNEFGSRIVKVINQGPYTVNRTLLEFQLVDIDDLVQNPVEKQADTIILSGIVLPSEYIPFVTTVEPFSESKANASMFQNFLNRN